MIKDGDKIILDDPHYVEESESEADRLDIINWFRDGLSPRLNSGPKVIIISRVNSEEP